MRPIPIVELPIWTDKSRAPGVLVLNTRSAVLLPVWSPNDQYKVLESRIYRCQRQLGYRPLPPRTNAESNQSLHMMSCPVTYRRTKITSHTEAPRKVDRWRVQTNDPKADWPGPCLCTDDQRIDPPLLTALLLHPIKRCNPYTAIVREIT